MKELMAHYDALAPKREEYLQKNRYYHSLLRKQYQYFVPKGKKVLEVGCATGDLLASLEPAYGVGIDISPTMIEKAGEKFPHLTFYEGQLKHLKPGETFDYVILSGLLGELEDIQVFFEALKDHCTNDTRIIIEYYSYFWQYILKIGEQFNLKMPKKTQNWLTYQDIFNFLKLAEFEPIKTERMTLFPKYIWGISYVINRFIAKLPFINQFTLNHFIVARPKIPVEKEYSVSILVPCRNEKGNIEQAILRTPEFGSAQEFLFVEGNSKDGTYEEVERVIKAYPDKDISLYKQTGKGKGDAVRLGFDKAKNDVLMILDADLTVPAEEMPKFYEAIRSNKGEFINGCRLIYPMESEAMRFLNLIANKLFGIFFSWLLGQRYRDTLCGTKVLLKKNYEELVANRSYFGDFDPFGDYDLIFGATKLNLKVVELPVRYKSREYGSTQIRRFRDGLLLIRMCFFAMQKIKFI